MALGGLLTGVGAGFYLGDSRSALEGPVPGQVSFLTYCPALWFWRVTHAALHGWRPLGVKALHLISLLLRKEIRCPEIIRCHLGDRVKTVRYRPERS